MTLGKCFKSYSHLSLSQKPDTAGENECIVVVFSLTDSSSLEDTRGILDTLWQSGVTGSLPLILVGNKTDLVRTRQVNIDGEKEGKVEALQKYFPPEARCVARQHGVKYVEVSGELDHNVDTLLVGIVKQIRLWQQSGSTRRTGQR